jgi:tRNA threonylcarbamoyladenosine biosynthesis protein TsaE
MMKIYVCTAPSISIIEMSDRKIREMISKSPEETVRIAKDMVKVLNPGDVVYLYGELGSGKTVFVKGVCAALGVMEDVTSPSFVIATEYEGSLRIAHIDLYRLPRGQVHDLPIEEYMVEDGITLIEWADRLQVAERGIRIKFTILDHEQRKIEIEDSRD